MVAQRAEDIEATGSIVWNYYKIDGVQSKRGGAKNVQCTFCDAAFSRCSSSRAFAHILGQAVLGQKRANVGVSVLNSVNTIRRGRRYKAPKRRRISGPLLESAYYSLSSTLLLSQRS